MNDAPAPAQLLAAVAAFLRDEAVPALQGAAAYQARVAANMLDVARRQLELAPAQATDELGRLSALLGADGDLGTLNRLLCERIAAGELTPQTPGLAEHLWRTTLAKLAVDQPGYATYRRLQAAAPPEES